MTESERGIALIIVLLVLALLLTVAGQFALAMRLEGTTTLNFRTAVTASYLAEAAYQRAVAEILPDSLAQYPDEGGLLVFRRARLESAAAPSRRDIVLGSGRFSYRITDEQARINLNRIQPDVLHRLLLELGVDRAVRDVIADSVLDWRDPNEEYRLNGAESEYYTTLPVPYRSKNADFDAVEELLQVKGVTREIFYGGPDARGLGEYLTVGGTGSTVNVNTASATVLRALGLARAEVDVCIAGRPYLEGTLPVQCQRSGIGRTPSQYFRIEASGEVSGQGRRTLTAVVQRRGQAGVIRVVPLSWRWDPEEGRP
ncbi:MAG: general secretion pathway protein GspK [Candidatus Rokuibacteriota bacterium]